MLAQIKGKYFLKVLFFHILERKKLKLIIYNKNLQNKLDIKLINYKSFSGKFIIYEDDGKGKEYGGYFGRLNFEGDYLNGKRHGKGKEYYGNGVLRFEGDYSNGKRHGKGKEYDYDGKLLFEGEYINNKRISPTSDNQKDNLAKLSKKGDKNIEYLENGKIKEYNSSGDVIFEGEYLNGKRNGKGKEYSSGELEFEGEYLNGERWKGKEYYNNGYIKFEGEYLNGKKWEGKIYDPLNNDVFELKNGKGWFREYDKRLIIEGEYINGLISGKGKEYNCDGILIFEGEYVYGLKNGNGKEYNFDEHSFFAFNSMLFKWKKNHIKYIMIF